MKKSLKWIGLILVGAILVILLAAGTLYVLGGSVLESDDTFADETLTSRADSAALARGAYLVSTQGCQECHGENLSGQVFVDAPPFLVSASNLTSGTGGIGGTYTDADWERAIRHGVRPGNKGLLIMPAKAYHALSDDETADLIAYLKTLPPVDNELPKTALRPMGRIIAGTGGFYSAASEIDHTKAHLAMAPSLTTPAEYGKYRTALCAYCHGADLHGGPPLDPESPPAPDLYAVTGWTLDQFKTLMRTGVNPNGVEYNPEHMPWTSFRYMTEAELEAIYTYLQTLRPAGEAI